MGIINDLRNVFENEFIYIYILVDIKMETKIVVQALRLNTLSKLTPRDLMGWLKMSFQVSSFKMLITKR